MQEVDEVFDTFEEQDVILQSDVSSTEVTLQEVSIDADINEDISDNLQYPCIIVEGIETTEEVNFFKNRIVDEGKAIPMYIAFKGYKKQIGYFELTLDNLLLIRCISDYSVRLYKDKKNYLKIDLHAPEQLIKFIRL